MDNHIAGSINAAAIRQAEALEQIAKLLHSIHETQKRTHVEVTNLAAAIRNKR